MVDLGVDDPGGRRRGSVLGPRDRLGALGTAGLSNVCYLGDATL